jgi:hypothetical protein
LPEEFEAIFERWLKCGQNPDELISTRAAFSAGFRLGGDFALRINQPKKRDDSLLTPEELDLCSRGRHIEAIRRLRDRLGLTLTATKRYYDAVRASLGLQGGAR